ncbi:MAG TPA: sigma-70 family RNA polymerase sigma factor [Acidimicrobiales bacterium]|nr:sigma-70 family RNA polymerase sigma factor [Acidimicrobiales bacterium]
MDGASEDEGLLRQYLREIGREPLLSREDEARLAQAIEAGRQASQELGLAEDDNLTSADRAALEELAVTGERARDQMVRANLRLVVALARHWRGNGLSLLDLIQEGNLGLLRAVERFDYQRGFRFSTYATWWIRQAISRAVATSGRLVRLPTHTGEALTSVLRERQRLADHPGGTPSLQSLARGTGLRPQQVSRLLQLAAYPVSISEPVGEDGQELGAAITDVTAPSPPEAVLTAMLPGEVERLLARLDSLDRKIISLRFGFEGDEPWSMEAIAGALSLTSTAVRRSQARALRTLRRAALASPGTRELLAG